MPLFTRRYARADPQINERDPYNGKVYFEVSSTGSEVSDGSVSKPARWGCIAAKSL